MPNLQQCKFSTIYTPL
uniref:Uncharacterized protein n=1 Tax=Anguilla anguilla TaxID=7936 RepID=A0A0E9QT76_ANGAN